MVIITDQYGKEHSVSVSELASQYWGDDETSWEWGDEYDKQEAVNDWLVEYYSEPADNFSYIWN